MNSAPELEREVFHASIAIYSKDDRGELISEALGIPPSSTGERNGIFSWIYSTREQCLEGRIEIHLSRIMETFLQRTDNLVRFKKEGLEIRLWIFHAAEEVNSSFVLEPKIVSWLALFDSDICVDIWSKS